jgi:DNA-binding MarR family transcriptional regulator
MRELTFTAKKIMEVFRYFRIRKDEYLSKRLMLSKVHLWRDIEEKAFNKAADDLIKRGYIEKTEDPEGWKLLPAGEEYLKQLTLHFLN